ncbi:hypothetical protein [Cryptosporangium aurantiacum]|uniref:Uncharacterized protein n=1 Tax=Cryptosporangium aurantiacum TaxID=134849 RepID=A0A1M7TWW6_9ACTN|nr:hypothetical protein [Cryptosporangium aurantiacum]SHN75216.1 hypothetical protein SAMN05443668_107245 [Cryptosporangium aurantiacum]
MTHSPPPKGGPEVLVAESATTRRDLGDDVDALATRADRPRKALAGAAGSAGIAALTLVAVVVRRRRRRRTPPAAWYRRGIRR